MFSTPGLKVSIEERRIVVGDEGSAEGAENNQGFHINRPPHVLVDKYESPRCYTNLKIH